MRKTNSFGFEVAEDLVWSVNEQGHQEMRDGERGRLLISVGQDEHEFWVGRVFPQGRIEGAPVPYYGKSLHVARFTACREWRKLERGAV